MNLEILDISYTSITAIPNFIFEMPKIKQLNYFGCKNLKSQPANIAKEISDNCINKEKVLDKVE